MPVDEKLTSVFLAIRNSLARAVSSIVPPKEIEDVVQETYVRVCQIKSSKEIVSPRSFMFKTARNVALNYVNRAETRLVSSYDNADELDRSLAGTKSPDALDAVCSDEDFSQFCDVVRRLPVQCRRAFVLKKVYGHSYQEIATTLDISEKTVEKHISKGLSRCREHMLMRERSQTDDLRLPKEMGHE